MQSHALCQMIREAGYEPMKYSGRGMYGKECVAFTAPSAQEGIMHVAYEAGKSRMGRPPIPRIDQLGMEEVIYWPSSPWIEPIEEQLDHNLDS
jgi:hypothetical protein